MRLNDTFIQEIKLRNDIESVVSQYVTMKRRGSNLVGLCPFHNEKTGSFTLYPQNGSFYCFGCGAGGDVITFQMKIENVDYMEAVHMLADRAGLQMPDEGYDDSMQRLRMRIYEINRAAARFFHEQLVAPGGKKALEYLTDRGLTMNTIRRFGLGYSPDSWRDLYNHMKGLGYSDSELIQADLVNPNKNASGCYDRFRKRVMYPIIDLRGNVIAFGGRIMPGDDSPAKYINTSDTPVYKKSFNVYAMNLAKNSKRKGLILCEGYMDVIAMHQAGFDNAVAACGTSFTEEQARLLARYTDEIIVTMDADAAGEKSTNRTIEILSATGVSVRVLRLPDAKDPDEYIKKFGPERFKALLDGAGNDIEYRLSAAESKFDLESDSGKLGYLREASTILAGVGDSIARALYAGRLAQRFDIPLDSINREIEYIGRRKRAGEKKKFVREAVAKPSANDRVNPQRSRFLRAAVAEERVIRILMYHPALFDGCDVSADDFVTDFNRRVFERLEEMLTGGITPDISLFGGDFTPDEMGRIVEMTNAPVSGDVAQAELYDCIKTLRAEKSKLSAAETTGLTDADWAKKLQEIGKTKRGEQ